MSELKVGVKVGYDGKELSSGIDNSRRKLSELAQATHQNELSARQMSAALRGVPAQFTDIVTALQSGQRPLSVLLQQGGQLKDMFGGIAPAARALGGYILGLINPLTITGAAIGVVAAGFYKGSQEASEFRRALILTGNAAGTTVERLSQMRDAVATATGATRGAAAEAIAELASTGKVAERAMQGAAQAAIAMSRSLGVEVSDTVKEFEALGKSPVASLRKLGEQYGYLTVEQLKQVESLVAVGKEAEAARYAQEQHAEALKNMAADAQQNLGYVEQAWIRVKDAVKATADAVASVGRDAPLPDQIRALQDLIARKKIESGAASRFGGVPYDPTGDEKQLKVLEARLAAEKTLAEIREANKERGDAALALHALENKALSQKVKYEQELAKIRNTAEAAGTDLDSPRVKRLESALLAQTLGVKTRSALAAEYAELKKINDEYHRDAAEKAKARGAEQSEINAIVKSGLEINEALAKKFEEGAQKGGRAMRSALTAQIDLAAQLAAVTQKAQSNQIRAAVILGEMSERDAIIAQAKAAEDKLNADILASRQKLASASAQEAARLNAQLSVLDAERLAAQEKLNSDLAIADQKAESERLARQAEAAKRAGDMQTAYTLEWQARHRIALKAAIRSGNEELAQALEDGFKSGLSRVKFDDLKRQYDALFADMTRQIEEVRHEAERDGGLLAGFAADERVAQIRDELIPQLQALIDKMREAGAEPLITQKTVAESTRALRKITNEGDVAWRKFTDDIERGLTDSLFRSFESGKGFGRSFIDSVKNLFKTSVLKIAVQGTVQGGLDLIGLGGSSGGSKLGALGNIFSLGKNAYEIYSGNSVLSGLFGFGKTLGGGLTVATTGGVGAGLSFTGAGISGALGGGIGGGALGSGITGGLGGGLGGGIGGGALGSGLTLTGPGVGAGLSFPGAGVVGAKAAGGTAGLGGMSTLGWIGLGLGAAAAIFGGLKKRGGPKLEGNAFGIINADGSLSMRQHATGGETWWRTKHSETDRVIADMLCPVGVSITETIRRLGGSAAGLGVNLGFNSDPKGKAPDNISGALTNAAGQYLYRQTRDAGRGSYESELQLEIQRMMLAAVRAADVAQVYKDVAGSVDLMRASAEQITAALADIGNIADIRAAFERVGLSTDAVSTSLINAAGGFEGLSASLSDYYEGYFSAAEKTARLGEDLTRQFTALGLAMPQTRAGFRALVEGLDATGEAGRQTLAALLGMSSSFGQWADAVNGASAALSGASASVGMAMQQLRAEAASLQVELLRAQGRGSAADAAQRKIDIDGMSAEEIAQYDANARLRAQVEAAQRLAQMQEAQRAAQQEAQRAAQQKALNAQVSAARQVAETFARIAESLKKYREGLLASDASPLADGARYAEARRQYQSVAARARLGDVDAAENMQEAVSAFLRASKASHTDASAYRVDFAEALASLDQVTGMADRKGSIAQQQLQVAQAQLDTLNAIRAGLSGSSPSNAQTRLPTLVKDAGRLAADWANWFVHTQIGQTLNYEHGSATRLSQNRGLYTDTHGRSYVFSRDDDPYTLADKSEEWAAAIKRIYGQWRPPGFAAGGAHAGGWRIVGEHGPEIEYTPPSRIYSNAQSRSLLDLSALLEAINALRADLRAGQAQGAHNTGKILALLDRVSRGGSAILTEAA